MAHMRAPCERRCQTSWDESRGSGTCVAPRLSGESGTMKALILNGTLKPSPEESNTDALATFVGEQLAARDVEVELIRLVDEHVAPGVVSEAVHPEDGWPRIHDRVVGADIVVFATPTWLGQPGSVVKGALERLDALISETQEDGTP